MEQGGFQFKVVGPNIQYLLCKSLKTFEFVNCSSVNFISIFNSQWVKQIIFFSMFDQQDVFIIEIHDAKWKVIQKLRQIFRKTVLFEPSIKIFVGTCFDIELGTFYHNLCIDTSYWEFQCVVGCMKEFLVSLKISNQGSKCIETIRNFKTSRTLHFIVEKANSHRQSTP